MAILSVEALSPKNSSGSPVVSSNSSHGGSLELSFSAPALVAKKQVQRRRPIIRVVQVFAPKLFQTDIANFRSLVQKLTGNNAQFDVDEEIKPQIEHDYFAFNEPMHECAVPNGDSDYKDFRILDSSRQIGRKTKHRESSFFDIHEPANNSNREKRHFGRSFEDLKLEDGIDSWTHPKCERIEEGNNRDGHDRNEEWLLPSFDGGAEPGVHPTLCSESARIVDDVFDGFLTYDDVDEYDTFRKSSSIPVQDKVAVFDERRRWISSF